MELVRRRGALLARAVIAVVASLAIALAFSAMPALAATITVNQPETGHNYSAYQVLDGTVTEEAGHTNVRLSNVQWGKDVDGAKLLALLKGGNAVGNTEVYAATKKGGEKSRVALKTLYKDASTAADFAAIFDWASDNTALADTIAGIINDSANGIIKTDASPVKSTWVAGSGSNEGHYELSITDPGYYFIRDGESSANHYFMQVFNDDKQVAPKVSTPTVEKKVYENVKFHEAGNAYGTGFNDTADYSIGDAVPFKLIGTIPEMSAYNNGYQYQFNDTLSTSLDLPNTDDVKVYLAKDKDDVYVGDDGQFATQNDAKDVTNEFEVAQNTTKNSMTVKVNVSNSGSTLAGANDLRKVSGIYDGKNEDGSQKRTDYKYVVVVYKATLNDKAAVGQKTIEGNKLGDQHKSESPDLGNVNAANLEYSHNPNTPTDHGATDNDYVIVFTYRVDLTKASADDSTKTLAGATFQLKNAAGRIAVIESSTGKFVKWADEGYQTKSGETQTLTSDAQGAFKVIGLDDGTYTLHEVTPPNGYNTPTADWTITVSANTSNGQNGNGAEAELAANNSTVSYGGQTIAGIGQNLVVNDSVKASVEDGSVSATVTNTQGFQLPQTGAMGTMLLTLIGILLVAGAVVAAVIRRRAHDEA